MVNIGNMERKKEGNEELSDLFDDLWNLKDEILSEYNLEEEEKKIIWLILHGPAFQISEKLRDFINHKKRWKAIFELFKVIWRLVSEKNEIWFNEFANLDIESLKLDKKGENKLKELIKMLEKMINSVWDIKKNLKFTYLLSAVKNKVLEKKDSITDGEELLKKNLEVWDIILLNKKVEKKDIWTRLLEAYDDNYDTDFWHAAIVILTDPLNIRHSTAFASDGGKIWRVEETLLRSYLERCKCLWYDLLALRPLKDIKDEILEFSKKNLWKDYDSNAAIWWWLYWMDGKWNKAIQWFERNLWDKDDSYNCVEIIAQALDQDKLKDITHPNEFLEYMNIFTPVYMTTIRL